jgi:hypothetical protein
MERRNIISYNNSNEYLFSSKFNCDTNKLGTDPDGDQEVHDVLGVEEGALYKEDEQPDHKAAKPPDGSQAPKEEEPPPELKVVYLGLITSMMAKFIPSALDACTLLTKSTLNHCMDRSC